MPHTADIVVIGGGIIGCACAYYLARDGHRVVLVERGEIASGAASASGGWIIIQDKATADQVRLALASRSLYDDLALDVGVGLLKTGGLILATRDSDCERLRQQAEVARAGGVGVEVLDATTLRELEPALSPDLPGGLYCATEAVVDPPEVCWMLARRAVEYGAVIQVNTSITGIEIDHGRVAGAITSSGTIATPAVICAAGAWSSQIGAMMGLDIPVTPRRGHLIVTAGGLIRRPMLEAGYLAIPDDGPEGDLFGLRFVMQPRGDGHCLIGSSREFAGFDREVNGDLVGRMHTYAARFVPTVDQYPIERVLVGFRPYTSGGQPIIGRAGPDGCLLATGHEGEGVTLAPVTGRLVADVIAGRIDRTGFEMQTPAGV